MPTLQLTDENFHIVYCPVGFAHGFCVLSEVADTLYKQTAYYDPAVERGIAFDDPEIGIEWPLRRAEMIASDPVGASWGPGVRRAPTVPTWGFNQAAVGKIQTPYLMVSGAHDKQVDLLARLKLAALGITLGLLGGTMVPPEVFRSGFE